jgi:formylglycine-generating enzyme required for sulfatase activity
MCAHRTHGMRTTKPIGIFPSGPFGLFDVVGSVWQWTIDERGAPGDYGVPRVVRGGAWNNLPWSIGCAARNAYPPEAQFSNLGFRCARDA